jgi:hypothetical protein
MPDDFDVTGGEQLVRLSKALRDAGRTELRKEMHAALRAAAKPLIEDARAEARRRLPKRGGLAAAVAKAPQRVQVKNGSDPGVRIVVKSRSGAQRANQGVIRHPVFGNRDTWVDQKVRPGWFDDPMHAGAWAVRPKLEQAFENVIEQIVREVGD